MRKFIPKIFYNKKVRRASLVCFALFVVYFIFCLPSNLFPAVYSKLLLDRNGQLLEARIAEDGQWRFPQIDSVPKKYEQCVLRYEDQHFRIHPGVNPVAIFRAIYLNIKAGKTVSGGSTITMQTVRLMRKNGHRTVFEKLIEIIWAVRLECSYSKNEILQLYTTQAPYGGNVVGLETAAWRYFNRAPSQLSWAESAMLAVLPNAPGLIHLNKNRNALLNKRNKLLKDLVEDDYISKEAYSIAIDEPLPQPLNSLPHHAYHLVNRFDEEANRIHSTIDLKLQKQFNAITKNYGAELVRQNIHNLSAVLLDVETGEVLAYVGNLFEDNDLHAGKVDMLKSVRSSGSILKPLLYAAGVADGLITPKQLLPDYPINYNGYRPTNYNPNFDGLVPADEALYRSLNVPATWLMSQYGIAKFKNALNEMGFTSINRPANDYGLSLILGGAEVNLLELTASYAALANKLTDSTKKQYTSFGTRDKTTPWTTAKVTLDKASIYTTLTAISNTFRPETEAYWKNFSSSSKLAWKTGTSYGNRDAWAIGVNKKYAIGVWIGNSDGQGVSGLTGLNHAAPLLFQLLDVLPHTKWFAEPHDFQSAELCKLSGQKANEFCPETQTSLIPIASANTSNCAYHKSYWVEKSTGKRVYRECAQGEIRQDTFMIMPPLIAYYYAKKNPAYHPPPSWSNKCQEAKPTIQILHPIPNGTISLPLTGNQTEAINRGINSKVYYDQENAELYWELNGTYLGSTTSIHEKVIHPTKGKNVLSITDENGYTVKSSFEVK